jgi:hypothetical protein
MQTFTVQAGFLRAPGATLPLVACKNQWLAASHQQLATISCVCGAALHVRACDNLL